MEGKGGSPLANATSKTKNVRKFDDDSDLSGAGSIRTLNEDKRQRKQTGTLRRKVKNSKALIQDQINGFFFKLP